MPNYKVVTGDEVGAFASKYNSLSDTVINNISTNNGVDSSVITFTQNGGGTFTSTINTGNVVTGLTYADIRTLKQNSQLVVGKWYKLSFNTVDCISYTDTVYTGATETLYLTPASSSEFYAQVISEQYPNDIIYYDFNNEKFRTDISNTTYNRYGYIYYRKDCIRNIEVQGYDFRTHIIQRFNVDTANYNQWSSGSTYTVGSYVWNGGNLFLCYKAVASPTTTQPSSDGDSWLQVGNSAIALSKTGSTNYGLWTLYANASTLYTGYTFGSSSSINNTSLTCYDITIKSKYQYIGNGNNVPYNSSNYTHKPNIVFNGGVNSSLVFDGDTVDMYFVGGISDSYFKDCNNITITSVASNLNFYQVSSTYSAGPISTATMSRVYNSYFTNVTNVDILNSGLFNMISCVNSTLQNSTYITQTSGQYNQIDTCIYINLGHNSTYNKLYNTTNSYIYGTYNQVSNSSGIKIGDTGYYTYTKNIITDSTTIYLYGSNNTLDNCSNFGVNTGYVLSSYSKYDNGCTGFDTYNSVGITKCHFGNGCANINLAAYNISLDNCDFAPLTKNISFSTSAAASRAYSNIRTGLAFDGSVINSGGSGKLIITLITINNKNFTSLDGSAKLVETTFSTLTPSYSNISSYQ